MFQATVMAKKYTSSPLMSLGCVLFCVFLKIKMTLKKKLKYRKSLEPIFKSQSQQAWYRIQARTQTVLPDWIGPNYTPYWVVLSHTWFDYLNMGAWAVVFYNSVYSQRFRPSATHPARSTWASGQTVQTNNSGNNKMLVFLNPSLPEK